jgi:hypothetical protein
MFIVRRVSGRLEDRRVHCHESKWKANMEAGTSYITKRLSGRLLGRHVHFLTGY